MDTVAFEFLARLLRVPFMGGFLLGLLLVVKAKRFCLHFVRVWGLELRLGLVLLWVLLVLVHEMVHGVLELMVQVIIFVIEVIYSDLLQTSWLLTLLLSGFRSFSLSFLRWSGSTHWLRFICFISKVFLVAPWTFRSLWDFPLLPCLLFRANHNIGNDLFFLN